MVYTQEFVQKCKNLYPNDTRLHEALNNGSQFVGRLLHEMETGYIKTSDVLKATSLEELQSMARLKDARCALYGEWLQMYHEQITQR